MPWLRGTPREPLTPWLLQPKLLMKWLHSLKLGPQLQVNPTELLQTRKRNQNRFKAPCVSWFEISREQLMCWGRILILSNVIYDPWIFKFERLVALRKTSCSKHFSVFTRESAVVNNRFGNAAKFRFTTLLYFDFTRGFSRGFLVIIDYIIKNNQWRIMALCGIASSGETRNANPANESVNLRMWCHKQKFEWKRVRIRCVVRA